VVDQKAGVIQLKAELEKDFFVDIPSEFEVNGIDVKFKKRYANQFTKNDLPAIIFNFIDESIESYIYFNKLESITNKTVEYKVFEDGKYTYELDYNAENIIKIEKLIKSDEENTIGDYWKEVENGDNYWINQDGNLEFQANEESLLDDDRKFRVIYEHKEIKVNLGGEFIDRIQIDVVTSNKKYDYDDSQKFINGILLKKEVTRKLIKYLRLGFQHPDLVIREVSEATDISEIEGEDYHYRNTFDVEVAYREKFTRVYDSFQEVEFDLNIDGEDYNEVV